MRSNKQEQEIDVNIYYLVCILGIIVTFGTWKNSLFFIVGNIVYLYGLYFVSKNCQIMKIFNYQVRIFIAIMIVYICVFFKLLIVLWFAAIILLATIIGLIVGLFFAWYYYKSLKLLSTHYNNKFFIFPFYFYVATYVLAILGMANFFSYGVFTMGQFLLIVAFIKEYISNNAHHET